MSSEFMDFCRRWLLLVVWNLGSPLSRESLKIGQEKMTMNLRKSLNQFDLYKSRSNENCPLGWWLMRVRISMFFCTSLFCFLSVLFFPSSFSLVHFVYTFSLCFLFFVVLSLYQSFHFFHSFVLLFFRSFTRSFMLFIYSSFLCSLVLFLLVSFLA